MIMNKDDDVLDYVHGTSKITVREYKYEHSTHYV